MSFSIEKKGYSVDEVDAYIDDLEAKYVHLQSRNAELEQKLATAKRLIRRFSDTENALKQNIADSKRAAAYMISDARDRSDELLDSTRESCGEIISDLDMRISEKMNTVDLMKAEVSAFKDRLFELYSSHIEFIDKLAQSAEEFSYTPDYSAVADAVDKFEEHKEPECTVPEFVEYPEESIFAEIEEEPEVSDDFVMVAPAEQAEQAESTFEADIEDLETDGEEFADQLTIEGFDPFTEPEQAEEEYGFEDTPAAEEELELDAEDELEDQSEFEEAVEEIAAEAVEQDEESSDEETDYFKFLSDFANSEEDITL